MRLNNHMCKYADRNIPADQTELVIIGDLSWFGINPKYLENKKLALS